MNILKNKIIIFARKYCKHINAGMSQLSNDMDIQAGRSS